MTKRLSILNEISDEPTMNESTGSDLLVISDLEEVHSLFLGSHQPLALILLEVTGFL